MGGEIKLNEKEKWAAYFSAVLKTAGYGDASKYLHVMAYGRHRPIDDVPIGLMTNNRDFVRIMQAAIDAKAEIDSMPKHKVTKKDFKPTLMEDMHGDKEDENV